MSALPSFLPAAQGQVDTARLLCVGFPGGGGGGGRSTEGVREHKVDAAGLRSRVESVTEMLPNTILCKKTPHLTWMKNQGVLLWEGALLVPGLLPAAAPPAPR